MYAQSCVYTYTNIVLSLHRHLIRLRRHWCSQNHIYIYYSSLTHLCCGKSQCKQFWERKTGSRTSYRKMDKSKSRKVEQLMMHIVNFEKPKGREVSVLTFHLLTFWNSVRCLSSWTSDAVLFFQLRRIADVSRMLLLCLKMKHPALLWPLFMGNIMIHQGITKGFGWYMAVLWFSSTMTKLTSRPLVRRVRRVGSPGSPGSKVNVFFASSLVLDASSKRRSPQEFGAPEPMSFFRGICQECPTSHVPHHIFQTRTSTCI